MAGSFASLNSSVNFAAGAVGDLFGADSQRTKAKGDALEADSYRKASSLASENADYAVESANIKAAQSDRQASLAIGGQQADIAASGFANSGSALDILRDSASQGALAHATLVTEGSIQEAGYKEQAASYQNMAQAADFAKQADENAADGMDITAAIKGVATVLPFLL